jgi:RNA polymerase sigma-70 factor (ECF subfamily)
MDSSVTIRFPGMVMPSAEGSEQAAASETAAPLQTADEILLSQVCEGSREALALLFRRYARIVRGVAYRVLRDPSEADDLVQDIFLLVHRLCRTFDASKGSARFWILQMTYRRALSRRRYLSSRHFYSQLDLDDVGNELGTRPGAPESTEDSIHQALDNHEALRCGFDQLSESQRQTLQLFFFEGYTFEEIASRLGQSTGNVRHYYYRALERLRKKIFSDKLPGRKAV